MRITLLALALLGGCPEDPSETDTHIDTNSEDDADGDGFALEADCDDTDPARYPGAPERCNGLDDDCDDALATGEDDADSDGLPDCDRCDQAGFWAGTRDENAAPILLTTLHDATDDLVCGYSAATAEMFLRIDWDTGWVECVYTGRTTAVTNQKPDSNDMNTEHSWPKSEGASAPPAECDLHHLYPTDTDANSTRGNYPFGVVASNISWSQGGSKLGRDSGGATVFEPRDEHKGNVARSMLYFSMRYQLPLPSAKIALFKSWSDLDPVDEAEWQRTKKIADYQMFHNPFVACPDLVDRAYP